MAYRDPEVGRARGRERFQQRVARRRAAGLCPRCGAWPPAPDRALCESCAEKQRAASRARDARLRAEGRPRRDLVKARASDRRRHRRQVDERREAGLCVRCGKTDAAKGAGMCEGCAEKKRAADRRRYAKARASGALYGGKGAEAKRRSSRERSKRRYHARLAAGLCTKCGRRAHAKGRTVCDPFRDARSAGERRIREERRSAGCCGKCGAPSQGASRCKTCAASQGCDPEKKKHLARRRYWKRRARHLCTDCGAWAGAAARCPECARRSYLRSSEHRGMPVFSPRYTVVDPDTLEEHGSCGNLEEVAMCLAFAGLSRDRVEVLADEPEAARFTAWE